MLKSGPFYDPLSGLRCLTTNCAPHTRYSDYILSGLQQLYENKYSEDVVGIYYDLSNNYICSNPLNGTEFTDAFGRKISKLIVMGLRRHMLRTLRLSREYGKVTMWHAHSMYNPVMHAFGDFWYPGEQYCAAIQQAGTPYYYSDNIPEDVFRSELNMFNKGSAIRFLGELSRANKDYGTREQTMAMCTKLLLNDIPVTIAFEDGAVINQIWKVFKAYDLDSAEVVHFYNADNQVDSDNPQIKVTYYRCSGNRLLMVVGNISSSDQQADIDISHLFGNGDVVRDEFNEKPLAVESGRIQVTVPARQFMLVGIAGAP